MRTRIHTALTVAAVLLGCSAAAAQTVDITTHADEVWNGTAAGSNAGTYLDLGAVSIGDNRSDLIIGAPGSASVIGHVYMIFGGPQPSGQLSLASAHASISGAAAGDLFGAATAAGNVVTPETSLTRNLIVAAPNALGGRGAVYVFKGPFQVGDALTTANAQYTILGNPGDHLGTALATADLNNDGYREIIIGASGNDRMYVINGGPTLSGTRDLSVTPADLLVGLVGVGHVLAAGDVTGDGIADLLVGSADMNVVALYKGRATGGIPTVPDAAFSGVHAGDRAGASIRLVDIDHDGIRDIAIGAPGVDGPDGTRTDSGAAYVLWGGPGLASRNLADADIIFYGASAGLQMGTHISGGDVNRDVPSDLVMMGPGTGGSAGELEVYYGRQDRTLYGVAGPGTQRIVDFVDPANEDRKIIGDASVGAITTTAIFEVTGEGARDIIASVPSANSAAGSVFFTVSPAMRLSTASIGLVANDNGMNTGNVTLNNPSIVSITFTATADQPWLSANVGAGTSSVSAPGTIAITASPNGLAPGNYTGTVTVRSTSKHLEMFLPVAVNLTVTKTRVTIDGPASGSTIKQPFVISGWALDMGPGTTTGVDAVHVYAYPNPGSGEAPVFIGAATYGTSRPDVGSAFGSSRFNNSGYGIRIAGLNPGPYLFVAYAHNTATGVFTASAGADVTPQNDLMIAMDTPSNGSTVTSAFQISGWALDRARASGSGVDGVDVYVIPSGGGAMFMGHASYGWSRSDVAAAFGSADFTNTGYHFTIAGLGSGTYTVAAYPRSTVTGQFGAPATATVTISTTKLMSIDLPAPESTVTGSAFGIAGWAVDRSAPTGTGVDAVHIWAYHNPGSGEAPIFLGVASYGQSRPDVGSVLGSSRFNNSGYSLGVVDLPAGVWDIAVFAHSTVSHSFDNLAVLRIVKQ